jgi:MFS family permease
LTAVFAVYAVALLATLLLAGSMSDAVGRRPVLVTAVVVQAVSMGLFLAASGVGWLFAARIAQGVATGLVTAAGAATLIDLQPRSAPGRGALVNAIAPSVGLAAGAVVTGALVEYGPAPTRMVYLLLLALFAALGAGLLLVAEPVPERRRPSLRVHVGVPPEVRRAFAAALPALVATWALSGLYLSLGPSLTYLLEGATNRLVGGTAVALLCGTGGLAALVTRTWRPRTAMLAGCAVLVVGDGISVVAVGARTPGLFFLGSAIAGLGFGSTFLGTFQTLASLAPPARRGEVVAAIYVAAYLAFSVPAVVAGVLTAQVGLRATAIGYGAVVAALALIAIPATARAIPRR